MRQPHALGHSQPHHWFFQHSRAWQQFLLGSLILVGLSLTLTQVHAVEKSAKDGAETTVAAQANTSSVSTLGQAGAAAAHTIDVEKAFKDGKVTREACEQTDKLSDILDQIPKDDVNTLLQFKQYLSDCQSLIQQANTPPADSK